MGLFNMQLSRIPIIIAGILTFLPFVGLVIIAGLIFFELLFLLISDTTVNPLLYLPYLGYVVPIVSTFFVIYLCLGLFYIFHIFRNELLDTEKKVLWLTVLIILNGLTMPFYWYLYLWKNLDRKDPLKANT